MADGRYPRWLELEIAAVEHAPPLPQPDAPERHPMNNCTKCGKKLRSDNAKGVCSQAAECAKRVDGGDDHVLDRLDIASPAPKTNAVKRFRVVADALGFDADELLAAYCEGWLIAVKQGAKLASQLPEVQP